MHCPITDDDIDKFRAIFSEWTEAGEIFDVFRTRKDDGVIVISVHHPDATEAAGKYAAFELHKINGGRSLVGQRNICWVVQLFVCKGLNFMLPVMRGCVIGDSIKSALRKARNDVAKNFQSQITLDDALAKCRGTFVDRLEVIWDEVVVKGKKFQRSRSKCSDTAEEDQKSSIPNKVKETYDQVIGPVVRAWNEIFGDRTGDSASEKATLPPEDLTIVDVSKPPLIKKRGKPRPQENLTIVDVSKLMTVQAYRIGRYATTSPSFADIKNILDAPLASTNWSPDLLECVRSFCYLTAATMYESADYQLSIAYRRKAKEVTNAFYNPLNYYMQLMEYRESHPQELSRMEPLDFACRALQVDQRNPESLNNRFLKLNLKELLSGAIVIRLWEETYTPPDPPRSICFPDPSPLTPKKQQPLTEEQTIWKGWHEKHKWVVLDRDFPINRPDSTSRTYCFVRLDDMEIFWGDKESWKAGIDLQYFKNRLENVRASNRATVEKNLEILVSRYIEMRAELRVKAVEACEHHASKDRQEKSHPENSTKNFDRGRSPAIPVDDADDEIEREAALSREHRIFRLTERMRQVQKKDAIEIRRAVEARQTPLLVHFTRIENLKGILARGILPVSALGEEAFRNDTMRLDGFPEAASLSVSFPNYLMFYKYRCLNPDANWAVVLVSAEVFIEIPCLFFPTNAANGRFRGVEDEGLEALMGIDGFSGMFLDLPSGCRKERELPETATTDPQAEILAFAPVPPALIRGVILLRPDRDTANVVERTLPLAELAVGGKFFEPRADWRHWRTAVKQYPAAPNSFEDIPF